MTDTKIKDCATNWKMLKHEKLPGLDSEHLRIVELCGAAVVVRRDDAVVVCITNELVEAMQFVDDYGKAATESACGIVTP